MLLDVGCGSCLSGASPPGSRGRRRWELSAGAGQELSEDGHTWVGTDISPDMLGVAREREVEGDVLHHDMGHGMCFRPGMFDGVISVSALQWLCNADKRSHVPQKRLAAFFSSLYSCMVRPPPCCPLAEG